MKNRRQPEPKRDPLRKLTYQRSAKGIEEVNLYIDTQHALGNWPADNVWGGDDVIVALADTYFALDQYR